MLCIEISSFLLDICMQQEDASIFSETPAIEGAAVLKNSGFHRCKAGSEQTVLRSAALLNCLC